MSNIIKQKNFSYTFDAGACESCGGKCCTGESGYIYLSSGEITDIARLLKLDTEIFSDKYLYKHKGRYSIKERVVEDSFDCIFYDRNINGCSIYEARPTQCRTFPFWDYFKHRVDILKLECPGIIDD